LTYSHPTASQNISDDIFAYRLQQLTQKHSKMAKNVEKIAKNAKIQVKKPQSAPEDILNDIITHQLQKLIQKTEKKPQKKA
jgi:hypothetical protein